MTEEPGSSDDWETIVRYNEKILQQQNLTVTTTDHQFPQVENTTPGLNETARQICPASWRIERPSFKRPKPPKPTSTLQRIPKQLLPVQLFLNRQVSLLFLDDVQRFDVISS